MGYLVDHIQRAFEHRIKYLWYVFGDMTLQQQQNIFSEGQNYEPNHATKLYESNRFYNRLTPIGSYSTHENSPMNSPDFTESLAHATHCGMHASIFACIDFFTYSDDHPCRQSGLCPSRERSRSSARGYK